MQTVAMLRSAAGATVNNDDCVDPQYKKLRIALFSGNYNNVVDGPVKALNRLVGWLMSQGHQVLVFAPTIENPAIPPTGKLVSVPSIALPGRGEYRLALGVNSVSEYTINDDPEVPIRGRIKDILNDFNPDLLHLSAPDRLGFSALHYANKNIIPAVASFHTRFDTYLQYYHAGWLQPLFLKLMRNFYKRCQHVYVPSQSMIAELRRDRIGDDIRIWARGVDRSLFSPQKRDMQWRRSLGIEDGEVIVLFVGRIVLEKGLNVFAKAFNRAVRDMPMMRALIVGDGPESERFKKMLPKNSIFTGYQGGEDLARIYASADIFFNPSITETFGNVTLEAMASGLPTVCAETSRSVSIIEDGRTGLLGNSAATQLWRHLEKLAHEVELRAKMGANARQKSAEFNWNTIFDGLENNYRQAIFEYNKSGYKRGH